MADGYHGLPPGGVAGNLTAVTVLNHNRTAMCVRRPSPSSGERSRPPHQVAHHSDISHELRQAEADRRRGTLGPGSGRDHRPGGRAPSVRADPKKSRSPGLGRGAVVA